ncbi:MAG: dihydrodipicolinate reductase C-terminal domain-containing protein [Francisellaceae bacterium]
MKVAVIGKGKTGQAVINTLTHHRIETIYDSQTPLSAYSLNKADAAIVFIPANALSTLLPELMASSIPIICGTTGFNWDQSLIERINKRKSSWVTANNFSLSMVVIQQVLKQLAQLQRLMPGAAFSITETHHIDKVDSPSGTALSWKSWLDIENCHIESKRLSDVKGRHDLVINNAYETIELNHQAHDRALFAQGAIWAAEFALKQPDINGFHTFDELVRSAL